MKREMVKERIERIIYESDRHILRIGEAVEDLIVFMPLDEQKYISLDKNQVQALDQFLFRFSKLQDVIGRKLFKHLLILQEDDALLIANMPFIDILNRLERLNILEVKNWARLRDIRNELAHNYDDEPQEMAEAINKIYQERDSLIQIYNNAKAYYQQLIGALDG
ncbi:MAG: hypothetical protein QM493_01990 [Sulfurovum sp.]